MTRQNIYKTMRYAAALFAASLAAPAIVNAAPMYFYPAEPWMITQTGSSCRIQNQFNNGFILTLEDKKYGAGQQPAELMINFRQPVFTMEKLYNIALGFEGQAPQLVQARAKDTETLAISLNNHPGMLNTLLNVPTFNMVIEGNDFNFSLVGLSQQANNFSGCTGAQMPGQAYQQALGSPYNQMPTQKQTEIIPSTPYDQNGAPTGSFGNGYSAGSPRNLVAPPQRKPSGNGVLNASLVGNGSLYSDGATKSMPVLNDGDWTLEKATMRYQEAERQLSTIGQKLQKERAQCKMEKQELEALLFDPQLTSEQQLAKLSSLEEELKRAKIEMQNQKLQYETRIQILENQLHSF